MLWTSIFNGMERNMVENYFGSLLKSNKWFQPSFFTLSNFRYFFAFCTRELRFFCVLSLASGKCFPSMDMLSFVLAWQKHKCHCSSQNNNEIALIIKVFFAPRKIAKIIITRTHDNYLQTPWNGHSNN